MKVLIGDTDIKNNWEQIMSGVSKDRKEKFEAFISSN